MKICFVANADSIHTKRWAGYFVEQGHDVSIITHSQADIKGAKMVRMTNVIKNDIKNPFLLKILRVIFGSFHTTKFFSFGLNFIFGVLQAPALIRKIKPDILHAHFLTNHGHYAALANFHPFVVTPWGSDVFVIAKKNPFFRPITKAVLKKADLITYDGLNLKRAVVDLGADPEKTMRIYFGIDTKFFTPRKRSPSLRKKILGGKDGVIVIHNRGFDSIYNVELLLNAIPAVIKKIKNIRFVLTGRGPRLPIIKELVTKLGIDKYIFFAGFVPDEEMPIYMASADIYVSCSRSDSGLASSTSEGMVSGLPVLITETGASKDWITDGKNGYIIPMDNPGTLAIRLMELASEPSKRKKFSAINCKLIRENQDYRKEMGKLEKRYLELIKEASKNR